METTLLRHLAVMKHFSLLLFFLNLNISFSQDTLREVNSVMYSRYFVIQENNQFEYHFGHCTGVQIGRGNLKKNLFNWEFHFDSIPTPAMGYLTSNSNVSTDSVTFIWRISQDSSLNYGINKSINGVTYSFIDLEGITIPKSADNRYEIKSLSHPEYSLNINENHSQIIIFEPDHWFTFHSPGTQKLKKKGDQFYLIEKVKDVNEEKTWKFKYRKLKFWYSFN